MDWVFPIAGPPCFLDDELWSNNDLGTDEGNIFPDQQKLIDHYGRLGNQNGVVLLPGTVATVRPDECDVEQPVPDVRAFFDDKERYLREYQRRQRPVIAAREGVSKAPPLAVRIRASSRTVASCVMPRCCPTQRVAAMDEAGLDQCVAGYTVRLACPAFSFDGGCARRDRKAEPLGVPYPFRDGAIQPTA